MKRTKYFHNTTYPNGAIKRVNGNKVKFFSESKKSWEPSAYTLRNLTTNPSFKRVTRDQARKIQPKAFRGISHPNSISYDLSEKVTELLNQGWELYGYPLDIEDVGYAQAMTFTPKPVNDDQT